MLVRLRGAAMSVIGASDMVLDPAAVPLHSAAAGAGPRRAPQEAARESFHSGFPVRTGT
jgi:hypothetical protein